MSKQVKAIAMGFRKGQRIREGTIFRVEDHEKSKWFIPYEDGSKKPVTPKQEKEQVPQNIEDLI